MDTSYIETLSDEDVADLELVMTGPVLEALRSGTATPDQLNKAKLVDGIIADAPKLSVDLKIYKTYKTETKFSLPGELTDLGYLVGVVSQPNPGQGYSVFKIIITAGTSALEVSDGVYIVARGVVLSFTPTANVDATPNPKLLIATVRPALTASLSPQIMLVSNSVELAHMCWGHKCTTEHNAAAKAKAASKPLKATQSGATQPNAAQPTAKSATKPNTAQPAATPMNAAPLVAPVESEKAKLDRRKKTGRVMAIGAVAANVATNGPDSKNGGTQAVKTPAEIEAHNKKIKTIKKIAIGIGIAAVVTGLVFAGYKLAPGSVRGSEANRHSKKIESLIEHGGPELDKAKAEAAKKAIPEKVKLTKKANKQAKNLEALMEKGGPDLQKEIVEKTAAIEAGKNSGQNARDLSALNGVFLDQDDAAGFLTDLKKNEYSPQEEDALWDYAGVHPNEDPNSDAKFEKGPVTRFHRKLRALAHGGPPLSTDEQKTMDLVDEAIHKNSLPRDATLFRGADLSTTQANKLARMKIGSVVKDNVPMFTGLTEARAAPHYQNALEMPGLLSPVLFVIKAKKGLPAMHSPYGESVKGRVIPNPYLDKTHGLGPKNVRIPFIQHANKEEVILSQNQGLRITKRHKREDGVLVIECEAEAGI